ncbi:phosphoribosyltransferase [Patescibacteria group bacterium]|nr:phosphoribosyltransferase [Patescibacteria group bacterium]
MPYRTIKFKGEDFSYIAPTWDEMQNLAFEISKKMIDDGHKFDRIITLAKGGWPMTRSLVDFLQISEVASVGVKFYIGVNKALEKPVVYQDLPISVSGENVLLFDDVADSGKSLKFIRNYLKEKGVGEITTATLFYKPFSEIKPDYYGVETSDWIIFPYDAVESIKVLGGKWKKSGMDSNEIKKRYLELGFNKNLIEHYSK